MIVNVLPFQLLADDQTMNMPARDAFLSKRKMLLMRLIILQWTSPLLKVRFKTLV